jgi:hypothetical protein
MSLHISYHKIKVKVKVALKQATKAQRGSRGIALLFFNLGSRRGWVVNATPLPLYPPGKTRYIFFRRLGGPVWTISYHR